MKVDARSRWQYRIQSSVFVLLFIALLAVLAWLSNRFPVIIDLSNNQRNSLSVESLGLLKSVEKPLEITLFVSPLNESRQALITLFERYQHQQPMVRFQSLNPDLYPELLREHDIRFDGEVLLQYQGRSEKLSQVDETQVTNAIQRLLRQGERWLAFLQGHGEPDPFRDANHDYSLFATKLTSKGYTVENLNLVETGAIPKNSDVLVLASPKLPLLPGEMIILQDYLEAGGNLLWLADPEQVNEDMAAIAEQLTIEFLPGIIVDPTSQLMGLDRVDFALVSEYPRHPITDNLATISLFPQAQAIDYFGEENWQQQSLLLSSERSWSETGSLRDDIVYGDNNDEQKGPLAIGMTLARSLHSEDGKLLEQRIAVIGDADFLSNRYLGNGSNLDIGLNLLNWLSHDDNLIAINPKPAPDTRLDLSQNKQLFIALTFLLVLPAGLIICGLRIWVKRRKR